MRSKLHSSIIPGRSHERRMRAVGRVWPNGEFSLGYVPELEPVEEFSDRYLHCSAQVLTEDEVHDLLSERSCWADEPWLVDSVSAYADTGPVTLSDAHNSHRPPERAKYGLKGLTGTGRKMIRSGAYLLEKRLGRGDVAMITLTVPALPRAGRAAVARQWGKLTSRLVQHLSRGLLKQGRNPTLIGCVEVQTGRLSKYSEGYLHLHLVAPAHSNAGRFWATDANELRAWWKSALERVIGSTLPQSPRVETAIVKKSVEAYLAKYLSKGGDEALAAFIEDLGEDCVPGQWWFCSAPMRDAIRAGTVEGSNVGALLESLVEHLLEQGTGEGLQYIRHVDRKVGGSLVTCGWVGRLEEPLAQDIRAMLSRDRAPLG